MKTQTITPLSRPITATVSIPGSKSYTNRALLMAAATKGTVRIERPLICDDTLAMLRCLQSLGITIHQQDGVIEVVGDVRDVQPKAYHLDADLSGITIRFLIALACILPGEQTLHGKTGLNKRPVGELVDGLRQLGAEIEYLEREGFPPLCVRSSQLRPGLVRMDGSVSSQYFSALLMTAPLITGDVEIQVLGEQISKPYIAMTIDTLAQFGIAVQNDGYKTYRVAAGQHYQADAYSVEGDISSASYFFAAAALTGSTITVQGANPDSKQADMAFLGILRQMGAQVTSSGNAITVRGAGVQPIDVDMQDCPDQAMTAAVLAAFAPGVSVLRGVQSLRVKETERVMAVEQELAKMGIATSSTHDTLTIHGGAPHAASIATYGDHRMAMAFAVAGMRLAGMQIQTPEVVSKAFPEFWQVLAQLTEPQNIVLIGMRGTGKSTVGASLARLLNKRYIDMDAEIERRAGKTISELVAQHGWEHFRDLEADMAAQLGVQSGLVIATGGGVVLCEQNIAALKSQGRLVLLTAPTAVLAERLNGDSTRPMLTQQTSLAEELAEVWQQRRSIYTQAADITVATERYTPEAIAKRIVETLEANE